MILACVMLFFYFTQSICFSIFYLTIEEFSSCYNKISGLCTSGSWSGCGLQAIQLSFLIFN